MLSQKRPDGFTLIEMMIVVTAIGIMAAIAIPRYLEVSEKGRFAEAKSILSALRDAQVRYMSQNEHFTNVIGDLDTPVSGLRYFTVNIAGTNTATAVAQLPATVVATCVRNNLQVSANFPAGYDVQINQLGTISSANANVQNKLI